MWVISQLSCNPGPGVVPPSLFTPCALVSMARTSSPSHGHIGLSWHTVGDHVPLEIQSLQIRALSSLLFLTYLLIKKIYIFIWLFWVLVVALGIFLVCNMQDLQLLHVGSGSLSRDRSQGPCFGSAESQPLDHQGSPSSFFKKCKKNSTNKNEYQ